MSQSEANRETGPGVLRGTKYSQKGAKKIIKGGISGELMSKKKEKYKMQKIAD